MERKRIEILQSLQIKILVKSVKLNECIGYGQTIYSPFEGEVVEVYSEYKERNILHPVIDFILGHGKSIKFIFSKKPENNTDLLPIIGNHIIMKIKDKEIYSLFAHLRQDSIKVVAGDIVDINHPIAEVGHSGNSTAPHLHFQLMNQANLLTSEGIQCSFDEYEAWNGYCWEVVKNGIPEKLVPIKSS